MVFANPGLLSRDSRIADCTVRHPGVERPFSSFLKFNRVTEDMKIEK